MSGAVGFGTSVRGIHGEWPSLPAAWSYTSLRAAEECPRRWALSRATYPGVWTLAGYPPRPILPALVGDVMHRVLELILRALHDHECQTLADPCAVQVLRDLGGYSELATRVIAQVLEPLHVNPRVAHREAGLRSALLARVPDIRQRVQALLSRSHLTFVHPVEREGSAAHQRGTLTQGSHAEVELRVPPLKLVGRADLITIDADGCSITDYKTGEADAHHSEQIRTYALLWARDSARNPNQLPIKQLVLSYATHDEQVGTPTGPDLDALAHVLQGRIGDIETQLQVRPPAARPALAMCRLCSVRHICDEYWTGPARSALGARNLDFVDCEATVVRQNGPRSWIIETDAGKTSALLRTPTERPAFALGDRVRLLDLAQAQDDDTSLAILTMTQASEVYLLSS